MSSATLSQARGAKVKLERRLCQMLRAFEVEYGLTVRDLTIVRAVTNELGTEQRLRLVAVETDIQL